MFLIQKKLLLCKNQFRFLILGETSNWIPDSEVKIGVVKWETRKSYVTTVHWEYVGKECRIYSLKGFWGLLRLKMKRWKRKSYVTTVILRWKRWSFIHHFRIKVVSFSLLLSLPFLGSLSLRGIGKFLEGLRGLG